MPNKTILKSKKLRICLDCSGEIKPGDDYYYNYNGRTKKPYIYCFTCASKHMRQKNDIATAILIALQTGPLFKFELEKIVKCKASIHISYKKLLSSGVNIKRLKYKNTNKKKTTIYYISGSENEVLQKIENSKTNRPESFAAKKVYLSLIYDVKPKIS